MIGTAVARICWPSVLELRVHLDLAPGECAPGSRAALVAGAELGGPGAVRQHAAARVDDQDPPADRLRGVSARASPVGPLVGADEQVCGGRRDEIGLRLRLRPDLGIDSGAEVDRERYADATIASSSTYASAAEQSGSEAYGAGSVSLGEPEPDAAHGVDVARGSRVVAELAAQPARCARRASSSTRTSSRPRRPTSATRD